MAKMYTDLYFFHKIIHSLLGLSVYMTVPIFRYKKCDIYPSIYGIISDIDKDVSG